MSSYSYSQIVSYLIRRRHKITDNTSNTNREDNSNTMDKDIGNTADKDQPTRRIIDEFKFPVGGWIILVHELLERFAFYGTKVLITVYLHIHLGLSVDSTTIIYHMFTAVCYLFPIFGAIIADNYMGRYFTVCIIGVVYLAGYILTTASSFKPSIIFPITSIFVLAIGVGGIKSVVAAFGGDQVPKGRTRMVDVFFAVFYICINLGAFVAQLVTPIFRRDVYCFDVACYPLAFGVPMVVFFITYLIFVFSRRFFTIIPATFNVISDFLQCIFIGMKSKSCCSHSEEKHDNFLDYAIVKYPQEFIDDCKQVVRVIIIFTPVPVFWSLWDQQGSRFTIQATNMDGRMGIFYLKPEQIQTANPILIIILIPIFDLLVYPLCKRINFLQSPMSKILLAYVIVALGFFVAGCIDLKMDGNLSLNFGKSKGRLILVNSNKICTHRFTYTGYTVDILPKSTKTLDITAGSYTMKSELLCSNRVQSFNVSVKARQLITLLLDSTKPGSILTSDSATKNLKGGQAFIRVLNPYPSVKPPDTLLERYKHLETLNRTYKRFEGGYFNSWQGKTQITEVQVLPNFIWSYVITNDSKAMLVEEFRPSVIHVLWQIPQYIFISIAEILISVTTMALSYSAAPKSMKSLLQSVELFTIFLGNIIVVISALFGKLLRQYQEFFLFACLSLVAGVVNLILIITVGRKIIQHM